MSPAAKIIAIQNKARNAGRSRKNVGQKPKYGIFHTIAGRLKGLHPCPRAPSLRVDIVSRRWL